MGTPINAVIQVNSVFEIHQIAVSTSPEVIGVVLVALLLAGGILARRAEDTDLPTPQ